MTVVALLGFSVGSFLSLFTLSSLYGLVAFAGLQVLSLSLPRVLFLVVLFTSGALAHAYHGDSLLLALGFVFVPGATLAYSDSWEHGLALTPIWHHNPSTHQIWSTFTITPGHIGLIGLGYVAINAAADIRAFGGAVGKVAAVGPAKSSPA